MIEIPPYVEEWVASTIDLLLTGGGRIQERLRDAFLVGLDHLVLEDFNDASAARSLLRRIFDSVTANLNAVDESEIARVIEAMDGDSAAEVARLCLSLYIVIKATPVELMPPRSPYDEASSHQGVARSEPPSPISSETVDGLTDDELRSLLAGGRDFRISAPHLRDVDIPASEAAAHDTAWSRVPQCAASPLNPLPVAPDSPQEIRAAVRQLAEHFRSELNYGSIGYEHPSGRPDPDKLAYLWFLSEDVHAPVVGACCFRRYGSRWVLLWVWLHPYVRRQGILQRTWPFFRARFGNFAIQGPLSREMMAFVDAVEPAAVVVRLPG